MEILEYQEDLIPNEIAFLAKQKGFDLKCKYTYFLFNKDKSEEVSWSPATASNRTITKTHPPNKSVLQSWLRKKHFIEIGVVRNRSKLDSLYFWYYEQYDSKENFIKEDFSEYIYDTYESALEAALLEALKLI